MTSIAGAQSEYELVIIEPWDGDYNLATSTASGLNNLNQVSGGAFRWEGYGGFLWTRDTGKQAINLAGAINDAGVITGGAALRYTDGTILRFPSMTGSFDLNESNVVVGDDTGRYWGGCRWTRSAKVWDEVNGTRSLINLGVPAAHQARAINEANQVVGVRSTTGSCGDFEAFLFDLDTLEHIDIHNELLNGRMGLTEAFDINDLGVVIGEGPYGTNIGEVGPFIWSADDGFTFLPAIPDGTTMDTHGAAINNRGEVVGAGIVNDQEWHAFLWDDARGMRDLNNITSGIPADFIIDGAEDINENGWIIGSGHYGTWSPNRAVVLIPTNVNNYELNVSNLVAGENALFTITDGTSNTLQFITYSLRGFGSTHVPQLNVTLDLKNPQLLTKGKADVNGQFAKNIRIPAGAQGRTLYFQAAESNRTTDAFKRTVQ